MRTGTSVEEAAAVATSAQLWWLLTLLLVRAFLGGFSGMLSMWASFESPIAEREALGGTMAEQIAEPSAS